MDDISGMVTPLPVRVAFASDPENHNSHVSQRLKIQPLVNRRQGLHIRPTKDVLTINTGTSAVIGPISVSL